MSKKIALLSLGGTISMTEASTGGVVPTLSGEALLKRFAIQDSSLEIVAISFRQLASAQLSPSDLIDAAVKLYELAAAGISGVVISQGTDTIEETAFALDLLGPKGLPIVVTGAMRHPDAPGADGAANLRDAIMMAAQQSAAGIGATVVMDGEIHAARFVTKGNTATVRAFHSTPIGQLGWIKEGSVDLIVTGLTPPLPDIPLPEKALPPVAILKAALGDDGRLAAKLIDLGYAGAIVEGMGGGHIHPVMAERLAEIASRIPVIVSTRVVGSHVLRKTYGFVGSEIDLSRRGLLLGGWLTTGKLHFLLTCLLANGSDQTGIRGALAAFGGC
ncbi:MAG TPA: asparaginase [Dongiaceae bacterium]